MCKKIYLILAFFGFISLEIINAQWIIEKSSSKDNLNAVYLTADNSGWIVGDRGTILYGKNNAWFEYKRLTDENLYSVFMVDESNGWAVGSGGTILHFDGKEWEIMLSPTKKNLYSVSFINQENGVAVGAWGTILVYENGSWNLLEKGIRGNLFTVSAMNDLFLIGGGLDGRIVPVMAMEDNSERTLSNSFIPLIEISSMSCTEQNDIWAIGETGTILHFDGKDLLQQETSKKIPPLNYIYFSDENKGISVGYKGTILTYSGKDWVKQKSPVEVKMNGSAIYGSTYYAVGDSGAIVTWKRAGKDNFTSFNQNDDIRIDIYPNPSKGEINFTIPNEIDYSADLISIIDINGHVILQKRINQDNGGPAYQFNTSELNNGLYMLKVISSGGKTAIGKFIIKR